MKILSRLALGMLMTSSAFAFETEVQLKPDLSVYEVKITNVDLSNCKSIVICYELSKTVPNPEIPAEVREGAKSVSSFETIIEVGEIRFQFRGFINGYDLEPINIDRVTNLKPKDSELILKQVIQKVPSEYTVYIVND